MSANIPLDFSTTENLLKLVISTTPIAIWLVDKNLIITHSDGKALIDNGIKPGELVGKKIDDLYEGNNIILNAHKDALQGKSVKYIANFDDRIFLDSYLEPVFSVSNDIIGAVGFSIDITNKYNEAKEREKLEEQLMQAQKLESLGILASGIAHDFNNLLTGIMGNVSLAIALLDPQHQVAKTLEKVIHITKSASDLTDQMLTYSGQTTYKLQLIDLNQIIGDMKELINVSISKNIKINYSLSNDKLTINADTTQIKQVILNLVINASEAIGDEANGEIHITTTSLVVDNTYLRSMSYNELETGQYAYLEVSDTGCGMDEKTIKKIFDPFYTTKFDGRGLGLAIVQGIIRGHKGAIKVYSELESGSTFKILLPISSAKTMSNEIKTINYKKGTVLICDDEAVVLETISDILNYLDWRTLKAKNGKEAVDMYKLNSSIIKLAIIDMTMPIMNGEETFKELRKLNPNLPIIMMSGHNETRLNSRISNISISGFLQKPFSLYHLKMMIENVMK